MKRTLVIIVLAAAAIAAGKFYWGRTRPSAAVLRTEAVSRGDLVICITATGTVEPEKVVDVGAQVAGRILSFGQDIHGKPVDYCSQVEAGTVLARIDDALYTSEVSQAKAQVLSAQGGLQRAEADLEQAKAKQYQAERNWKRAQELGPSTALSGTDYDNYKTTFDSAQANVAIAEAAIIQAQGTLAQAQGMLERAERNLGYTTIASPVKGVIIDRRVNIGQTVVASLNAPSLFLIAKDLTRMQVWVAVNEADIGRLHPGQPVTFTVDAFPGESFSGQVGKVRLNASMTQNVVTYTVEVVADNAKGRLLPYLTANVKFELQRRTHVLMVPATALRWTPALERIAPEARAAFAGQPATDSAEPGAAGAAAEDEYDPETGGGSGILWVPEGAFVRPVFVEVGVSDDLMTEVQGSGLAEGMKVVIGEDEAQVESTSGSNPFLPKPPRGGKGGPPPPM